MTLLGSLLGLLLLIRGLGWLEKTSLYLQDKVWAVRITSMGLGCLPSCTTVFLWSQMVHNVVKMDCKYSKDPSSFQLLIGVCVYIYNGFKNRHGQIIDFDLGF